MKALAWNRSGFTHWKNTPSMSFVSFQSIP